MTDYDAARRSFSWAAVRDELAGLPGGKGLNIAHEAVDRHAQGLNGDRVALRWLGRDGRVEDLTYGELSRQTNRFANLLLELGVGNEDRVFALSDRTLSLSTWRRSGLSRIGASSAPCLPRSVRSPSSNG